MRVFRDGYNRTNLVFGSFRAPAELSFSAVNEPWDGPGVRLHLRFRRRWLVFEARWSG